MWFLLALCAALTQAGQFAVVKGPARRISALILILWTQALGLLAWAAYFAVTRAPYTVPVSAWSWVGAGIAGGALMSYLLVRASAAGDISIVGPVVALSPAFAIVPDAVMNGTWPGGLGWLGIALSVAGTVTLSREGGRTFALHRLFRRPDALSALGAALVLGLLSGIDRHNALTIGVPSYLLTLHAITTIGCVVLALGVRRRDLVQTLAPQRLAAVLGHATFVTAGTALLLTALTLAPAAYVSSVRRTSAVFSVVLGWAMFDEEAAGQRLVGALVATAGIACPLLAR